MANASAIVPSAELSPSNISDQVNRVLASNTFQNCATLQAFLRYITARALASDDASLSEQSIAIGVFGKDESFDSASDTIVRTQAYRLRQKLKEYYAGQGVNDPILIEIPRGHYRPIFNLRSAASPPLLDLAPVVFPAARRAGLSRLILSCCAAVVVLLALAAGIVIGRKTAVHESQNLPITAPQGSVFWKWFLGDEKNPVVAYSNDLYLMTTRGDLLYFSGPGGDRGTIADPAIARESMLSYTSASRTGPLFYEDDKSDVGEVVGAVALAETLTRLNIQPIFKRGRVITTYDLESHNIVFLGSPFVNKILNHVDAQADFVFEGAGKSLAVWGDKIRNVNPKPGEAHTYQLERDPASGAILADYAVVSCLPSLTPGRKLLILAGLTTSGTEAAAQFVTSPEGIQLMEKALPKNHNPSDKFGYPLFQFLLKVSLDHGLDVLHTECIASRVRS